MIKKKPWGGRFKEALSRQALDFSVSIEFDKRLYAEDITASIAHARALARVKVLKKTELKKIIRALESIEQAIAGKKIRLSRGLEDIHMNIESLLAKKVGKMGLKIHTGRSRNDQVVTDLRLYLKKEIRNISELIRAFERTIIMLAEKYFGVVIPGYTHKQRAQPLLFSHHLLAYFEMLERDRARLKDLLPRVDVLPLGSGALAGINYPVDRAKVAAELGFAAISQNSLDAVSDRDFVIEMIGILAVLMMHLSRFSEELILWSSQEYKFVELPDRYTTGSSIMPQKKNPDIPELIRGRTGKVYGHLMNILSLMKGLPLSYHRDMQEDKVPLFETLDLVKESLKIFPEILRGMKINRSTMRRAAERGNLTATDLADYLVMKGIPFRQAHHIVGSIVRYAAERGRDITQLSLSELTNLSRAIGPDVFKVLSVDGSIRAKDVVGGTAPHQVRYAIMRAKRRAKA